MIGDLKVKQFYIHPFLRISALFCGKFYTVTILLIGLLLCHSAGADTMYPDTSKREFALDGIDGPYIINKTEYRISANNELVKTKINRKDPVIVNVNNADQDKVQPFVEKPNCKIR